MVSQQPQLLLSAGDGDYHDRRRCDGNTSEGRKFGRRIQLVVVDVKKNPGCWQKTPRQPTTRFPALREVVTGGFASKKGWSRCRRGLDYRLVEDDGA